MVSNVRNGWKADIEDGRVTAYVKHVASDQKIPWIATLHVRPLPGQSGGLEGSAGAYAVVLALARDEAEYREIVAAEMETLGFSLRRSRTRVRLSLTPTMSKTFANAPLD